MKNGVGWCTKTMEAGLPSCLTGLKSLLLRYAGALVGLKSQPQLVLPLLDCGAKENTLS